ncbi:hypothetical protein D3C86_1707450 [compost metagenome]
MWIDRVGAAGQIEVAARDAGVTHVVIAGRIAQVLFFQATHIQSQAVDFLGGDQLTVVGRRQQPGVVIGGHR